MRRLLGTVIVLVTLAACSGPWPGQSLLGVPELGEAIRRHYARYAWERNATCTSPEMGAIARAEIIDDDPERTVIRVRYSWRANTLGDRRFTNTCQGFDERDFLVRLTGSRPIVLDMTGGQRFR